jgi:hypothetical protein
LSVTGTYLPGDVGLFGVPWPLNPQPNEPDFETWVYTFMGIPQAALPPGSVYFQYAFCVSMSIVNPQLNVVPGPNYMLAVYNLGGDCLINWTPDQPGVYYPSPPAPPGGTPPNTGYFAYLRAQYNTLGFTPGIITASNDQGTGQSMQPLDQYRNFTIQNMQQLKTPWGRAYLGWASAVGTLWGLS